MDLATDLLRIQFLPISCLFAKCKDGFHVQCLDSRINPQAKTLVGGFRCDDGWTENLVVRSVHLS